MNQSSDIGDRGCNDSVPEFMARRCRYTHDVATLFTFIYLIPTGDSKNMSPEGIVMAHPYPYLVGMMKTLQ